MGCGCNKKKGLPTTAEKEAANEKQRLSRQEAVEKFRRERQERLLAQRRKVTT